MWLAFGGVPRLAACLHSVEEDFESLFRDRLGKVRRACKRLVETGKFSTYEIAGNNAFLLENSTHLIVVHRPQLRDHQAGLPHGAKRPMNNLFEVSLATPYIRSVFLDVLASTAGKHTFSSMLKMLVDRPLKSVGGKLFETICHTALSPHGVSSQTSYGR